MNKDHQKTFTIRIGIATTDIFYGGEGADTFDMRGDLNENDFIISLSNDDEIILGEDVKSFTVIRLNETDYLLNPRDKDEKPSQVTGSFVINMGENISIGDINFYSSESDGTKTTIDISNENILDARALVGSAPIASESDLNLIIESTNLAKSFIAPYKEENLNNLETAPIMKNPVFRR